MIGNVSTGQPELGTPIMTVHQNGGDEKTPTPAPAPEPAQDPAPPAVEEKPAEEQKPEEGK